MTISAVSGSRRADNIGKIGRQILPSLQHSSQGPAHHLSSSSCDPCLRLAILKLFLDRQTYNCYLGVVKKYFQSIVVTDKVMSKKKSFVLCPRPLDTLTLAVVRHAAVKIAILMSSHDMVIRTEPAMAGSISYRWSLRSRLHSRKKMFSPQFVLHSFCLSNLRGL
ncbi:hypothetical protein J6590_036473 [Homalodisca vitripennis]|nr:hypothetical protein J6590_036473 [Homalodisca vitripennis]